MNPIAFDFTLIVQMILFILFSLLICGIIYLFVFVERKHNQVKQIVAKLDRIVDLLENSKKNL